MKHDCELCQRAIDRSSDRREYYADEVDRLLTKLHEAHEEIERKDEALREIAETFEIDWNEAQEIARVALSPLSDQQKDAA